MKRITTATCWEREQHQRNQISRAADISCSKLARAKRRWKCIATIAMPPKSTLRRNIGIAAPVISTCARPAIPRKLNQTFSARSLVLLPRSKSSTPKRKKSQSCSQLVTPCSTSARASSGSLKSM